jgi:DNA-directed RNA polymerase subunit RPC12/RpoP
MQLLCPHCRTSVQIPDVFSRFFDIPVVCYLCGRAFAVPPQNPDYDNITSNITGNITANPPNHLFERLVSAHHHNHIITCTACKSKIGLAGTKSHASPPTNIITEDIEVRCPVCGEDFVHNSQQSWPESHGFLWTVVAGLALAAIVLMLNYFGFISLRNAAILLSFS